jgi:hypothetical protein
VATAASFVVAMGMSERASGCGRLKIPGRGGRIASGGPRRRIGVRAMATTAGSAAEEDRPKHRQRGNEYRSAGHEDQVVAGGAEMERPRTHVIWHLGEQGRKEHPTAKVQPPKSNGKRRTSNAGPLTPTLSPADGKLEKPTGKEQKGDHG